MVTPAPRGTLAADYGVPLDSTPLGGPANDRGLTTEEATDGIVRLLSVGAVVRRKGFDVLVAALACR